MENTAQTSLGALAILGNAAMLTMAYSSDSTIGAIISFCGVLAATEYTRRSNKNTKLSKTFFGASIAAAILTLGVVGYENFDEENEYIKPLIEAYETVFPDSGNTEATDTIAPHLMPENF